MNKRGDDNVMRRQRFTKTKKMKKNEWRRRRQAEIQTRVDGDFPLSMRSKERRAAAAKQKVKAAA